MAGQSQLVKARSQPKDEEPLFGKAMSAFSWRFASESLRFVLQLTVTVVLARLIRVDQFGLLALAMVVVNLVIRISEIGIYYAVVQRRDLTDKHIRVAFTLSMLFGLFFTAIVYATAPAAAALLRNDEVVQILRAISMIFLFMNLGSTAMGLLQRNLDYRKLLVAELWSYGIGYVLVSVALAALGYGVWALVWATVVQIALRSALLLALARHPTRPSLALTEARELLSFGVGSSLSTLANYAAVNGDYFVVGRWLGATALGLYSRAYQLMTMPMMQFTSVIASVLFPVYSRIQDEDERLRRAYLNSVSLSAIIVTPLLTTIGITAPEIMSGIFGAEWGGAAAPLAILCASGPLNAAYSLGDSLARAKGKVYAKFRCHAIYAACVFAGSYIGSKWGVAGVAVGVVVAIIVMYLLMAQLTLGLVGASWKQYFLCQLPGAIIGASVIAVTLPITILLRFAQLPSLLVLFCASIMAGASALAAAALLPRDWFDAVTFDALEKLEQPIGKIVRLSKDYVIRHEALFKVAQVPFNWYQNAIFFVHVSRQGLWRVMLRSRRRAGDRANQMEMTWDVPFPHCDGASELISWLRSQGVKVSEGGHTFYIPPQEKLSELIPEIVNFYPPRTGFKALKNFGPPTQVKYMVKDNEAYSFLHRLIGTPRDQVVVANYMYLLGIGPRMWDLTCWKGRNNCYTVFAVDHAGDKYPTAEQCLSFLERLKLLNANSHLRIVVPEWERGEDFLPPDCHHNLRYSDGIEEPKYVDFQNFCLASPDAWSREAITMAHGALRRGAALGNGRRHAPGAILDYAGKRRRWSFILDTLHEASLNLSGRVVLDVGCGLGLTLHASLAEGAAWGFGWERPGVAALTRNLLLSVGVTRFSLTPADIHRKYRLEDDIPPRFQAALAEAVVFVRRRGGAPEGLRAMPWRVLVYEGDVAERLEDAHSLLRPLLAGGVRLLASSVIADEDGHSRPAAMLLRDGVDHRFGQ